jgi:hypothetical protein
MNMPTDREIRSMVFRIWQKSLNGELMNITLCLLSASRQNGYTDTEFEEYKAHVHTRLKALVKNDDIRRIRFLPGRPWYTI